MENVDLVFEDQLYVQLLSELERNTGARGLRSILKMFYLKQCMTYQAVQM